MKKVVILCMLLMFGLATIASASNLDAPAEKKVTVRSEIERGKAAVHTEEQSAGALKPLVFLNGIDSVADRNRQNNTDTDAFCFGLYGQAWIYSVLRVKSFEENDSFWRGRLSDAQIKSYYDRAATYYKQFRGKQKDLNISDADLKKLFLTKDEWLAEWDKKIAE